MSATEHTVDEALAKFDLIAGSTGNEQEGKACAMSMLSWVAGEAWTDHPPCAHRLLADMAIRANDNEDTTPEQREAIVRAGCEGIIDTWWVPATVILLAISEAPKDADVVDRALAVFAAVAGWKSAEPKVRPNLTGADLTGAYLAGARGNASTRLPAGWVVQEGTGLIVPATKAEVAG